MMRIYSPSSFRMNKRLFMGAVLSASTTPLLAVGPVKAAVPLFGPVLLTVTGAISRGNRGAFDATRDVMMHKHRVSFEKAWAFDFDALQALPPVTIAPTLEYDARVHSLRGPLLTDVLKAAGARLRDQDRIVMRAVDGYAATITGMQARGQRFVVATHLDGKPMALGGLGPLWAVIDADRFPDVAARSLGARFAGCPWALYHLEVLAQA